MTAKTEMTSVRLPAVLIAALRKHAAESGETLSDVMREAALRLLGVCPTCGRPVPEKGVDEPGCTPLQSVLLG